MGATTSSMSAEPILAAAAVAGALGYGYVHYIRPAQRSGDDDADDYAAVAPSLHGQKKRGRKLQLPGDATLKNLNILDAPVQASRSASTSSSAGTRQRQRPQPIQPQHQQQREAPAAQPQDVVPGGFDGEGPSTEDARHVSHQQPLQPHSQDQQQLASAPAKKPKKKKGKKATAAGSSEHPSASGAGSSPLASSTLTEGAAAPVGKGRKVSSSSAAADDYGERWTRVEARKKKATVPAQDDAGAAASAADVTTSDAGITTSATGNSSPVTERTTEDELPSELDESTMEVSAVSSQGAPPRVVPVRPLPGEQPAKGFSWEDYEGVQVDEDASEEEEGGWGVVRSRRKPNKITSEGGEGGTAAASQSQPQPLTKKQRQNAQRREALKELKREREAQQQVAFTVHKRELERARGAERAAAAAPKRTGSRFDSLDDS